MSAAARNRIAERYVAAFARDGAQTYIGNLETAVALHRWGEHALPVTINDGEPGRTFVCSPVVGYIDYPTEELSRFPNQRIVPALRAVIGAVGGLLARADANRIVHVNNWMMSTNLPVALDPALAAAQTEQLAGQFPAYFLAMRSLTRRHSAPLMDALEAAGWVMLPSRQVFLVDDVVAASFPRRDTKRDDKIWRQGAFAYEELTAVSEADAARIVELYKLLYLEKYSELNPHYTPAFVRLTHEIGMIRYLVLRDKSGVIQGFGGMHQAGRHATMPLIGYNTQMSREHALYRLTFHAGTLFAAREKLLFNMSSGAAGYKLNRGATAEMEFTAFYLRHLPRKRRLPFGALALVARRIGIPILRKYQL